MPTSEFADIQAIHDFKSLIQYLRKELKWPVDEEQADDLVFDYKATELGIDETNAVKIRKIKQLRPLAGNQPWGVFWIEFDQKRLPVVVMRRILSKLVSTQRGKRGSQKTWDLPDLMFIASTGSKNERGISFAHFQEVDGKAQLRTFAWDVKETHLYYIKNVNLDALRWPAQTRDANAWRQQWSEAFVVPHHYVPTTAEMLAKKMAQIATYICEAVKVIYGMEHAGGALHQLHLNLKLDLISDLDEDNFADMYAQTVTYGLFAARATRSGKFGGSDAAALIQHTNPFLRELLEQLMNQKSLDLDELGVTELTDLLGKVNMEAILQSFGQQKRGEDPVIHFYETFMHEYDPVQKVKRGEFYTPDAVVSFIVRSVDYLLRTEFDCPDGFGTLSSASKDGFEPIVLDPATGTGTFLKYVIEVIWDTFYEKNRKLSNADRRIKWNRFVRENVLPRLYAFELKMSPYTIAHMKVGLALREKGFDFQDGERLRIYLTNALQPSHEIARVDTAALAHEAKQANEVKNKAPITVIIGNPPYSVDSSNQGDWIEELMQTYKKTVRREESQIQAISNDYVKFIRLAQWRIQKTGQGIVGYVTNNGYLSGPLFRDMRKSLIDAFNKIYVLNLHGSTRWKEKTPDGGADQNVFDIQQGVAILFLVSRGDGLGKTEILYQDVWGSREKKYSELLLSDIDKIKWAKITPTEPFYSFAPLTSDTDINEYKEGWQITNIFGAGNPKKDQNYRWGTGFATRHDQFALGITPEEVIEKVEYAADLKHTWKDLTGRYRLCTTKHWNPIEPRKRLAETDIPDHVRRVQYRPFDYRYTVYLRDVVLEPRIEFMRYLNGSDANIAYVTTRITNGEDAAHDFCSRYPVEKIFLSNKTSNNAFVFPLYLFDADPVSRKQYDFLDLVTQNPRKHNLSTAFVVDAEKSIGLRFVANGTGDLRTTFGPEDVFHYMYAVFHSPAYRTRYSQFLKMDFPRLPLTGNMELFCQLCGLGNELVSLHLLESATLNKAITKFKGKGDSVVAKGYPKYQDGVVLVNATQGFQDVPEDAWEFHVGGYQVCEKWLKDRRERELSSEDIAHYQKIVVALKETNRLMKEVDEVIEAHGGWPMK